MIKERIIPKQKIPVKQKTAISILVITIIVFFYFAIMILLNKLQFDAILVGVIREMLTIPALVFLVICFVFSVAGFIKDKFRINGISFYALIIQLATAGLLVYIA